MTKYQFDIPQGRVTVLVMEQNEFDEFMADLEKLEFSGQTKEEYQNNLNKLRENKQVQLMTNGLVTRPIFNKYGITTDFLSVTVRGLAQRILQKNGLEVGGDEVKNALNAAYNIMSNDDKFWVDNNVESIFGLLKASNTEAAEKRIQEIVQANYKKMPRRDRLELVQQLLMGLSIALGSLVLAGGDPWVHEEEFKSYLRRLMTGTLLGSRR
jgi:hypothetical protein